MMELTGKYTSLVAHLDELDQKAMSQLIELCNQPFAEGSTIRIMPDAHAGAGCVIGTTMTITDKVVPNLVGVDIGCGVLCLKLNNSTEIDMELVDKTIKERVPSGRSAHDSESDDFDLTQLRCYKNLREISWLKCSLGTLGGGNHFIEIAVDSKGFNYLLVHSGSRNLGKQVAEIYQEAAYRALTDVSNECTALINQLKKEGRQGEIQEAIKSIKKPVISKELAYVEGKNFQDYLHDMDFAQRWAQRNREKIAHEIIYALGLKGAGIDTIHNYIDMKHKILRKGAISAQADEMMVIPMNMRDGTLLCRGKGNTDWNYSAPHGAGRIMSRGQAKQHITMEQFTESMQGIYTTSVNTSTIDEAPMAYKPMECILNYIGDTAEVIEIMKPLYNFKASE